MADDPRVTSNNEPRSSSSTAVGVASLRAAHLLLDDAPPILNDYLAARLIGGDVEEGIRRHNDRLQAPGALGLRSHVVLRSRHAEDRLRAAVSRGVAQFVLLGAGLDSFAYRQPDWASRLRVVEVDHPASQAAKQARLTAAGIDVPANVRFVALDLERGPLSGGALDVALDADAPVFVAALGVLPYLRPETVSAVFDFVIRRPRGSELVATFAQPPLPGRGGLADAAAAVGEPWLSRYEPAALRDELLGRGFADVSFLLPEEAYERYYAGRHDLPPPRRVNTVICLT